MSIRNRVTWTLTVSFASGLLLAAPATPARAQNATESVVQKIKASAGFKQAQAFLDQDYDRFVQELITLNEIPAPPFKEEARGTAYLAMLKDAGLADVERDPEGNVMGVWKGTRSGGSMLAVLSHLDTVFPEGTDVRVKREGTKLSAPGIGDDTRALALMLTVIRAMKAANLQTRDDILFVGNVGAANAVDRMAGFIEGAGSGFSEISRLDDGGDRAKARSNVEATLDQHPECTMLAGIWAYNTPQIVSVVRDRQIRDKVKVVCFDAAEASIREMGEGNVDVMVVQNPYQMGFEGVKLLLALAKDDQSVIKAMYPDYSQSGTGDIYSTELRVVIPDTGSSISPDLLDGKTKFFKHSEFLKWLSERGLSGS